MTPGSAPAASAWAALAMTIDAFGVRFSATVWDACGVIAQIAFTWRVMHQWVVSEREGRSVLPLAFWSWSLVGAAFDLAYCLGHRDPVLTAGAVATAPIFARNWWIARRPDARPATGRWLWLPLVIGVLAYLAVVAASFGPNRGPVRFDSEDSAWLVVGFVGTVGWTARFVIQWWATERSGESHLPPSFFVVGLASCLLLLGYTVSQGAQLWVKVLAGVFTVVPYARNLVLLRRHRPPTAPTVGDPGGAAAAAESAGSVAPGAGEGPAASARAADPA